MNGDDRVVKIFFPGEKGLDIEMIDVRLQLPKMGVDLFLKGRIGLFLRKLNH